METIQSDERVLTPEETTRILGTLEVRFHEPKGMRLHEGIAWEHAKLSLQNDVQALWSIARMEEAGHQPDLYHEDDGYYYFGTCSIPSPFSARECIYDPEADPLFRKKYAGGLHPKEFKGNAIDKAEEMQVELMPKNHYMILQKSGMDFDQNGEPSTPSSSYLQTPDEIRERCKAILGFRCDDGPHTMEINAGTSNRKIGWRGYKKVKKTT